MPRIMFYLGLLALFVFSALMFIPAASVAAALPGPGDAAPVPDGPAATALSLYLFALSAFAPLVGYALNHYSPLWVSEQAKGVVHAVLAAGVAVLYQAASPGDLGLNDGTLLAVLTAMGGALAGHLGWTKSAISVAFGAGTNRGGAPSPVRAGLSAK